jgi:hypothetical protein
MSQWQTPVTRIVLIKCHACKVPPGYHIQPSHGVPVPIPQTFTVPKNILVIESSRQGFITSCPRRIEYADGVIRDNPREPLQTFLASIANTGGRGTLTFQDVIDRFSQTIVPSKKKQRKQGVSHQLIENTKGVARVRDQMSPVLTMNESLLFGSGVYCDQGIFVTNPGVDPIVREVPSEFGLINIHDYALADLRAISYSDVRQITPENFFGQYYPANGTIGDHALLSEILNNPFIHDGTAVILIACKSICGIKEGFRHGEHDGEFYELFASEEELDLIKRTQSSEYLGTLKQVITNDAPSTDTDSDDDDDEDGDQRGKGRYGKGGKKLNKASMKKTKHKTRKTKKRRKVVRNNNKNKNKDKKRTVSVFSSTVK